MDLHNIYIIQIYGCISNMISEHVGFKENIPCSYIGNFCFNWTQLRSGCKKDGAHLLSSQDNSQIAAPSPPLTPQIVSVVKKWASFFIVKKFDYEAKKNNAHFLDVFDKKTIFKKPPPPSPPILKRQKMSTIYFAPTPKFNLKKK